MLNMKQLLLTGLVLVALGTAGISVSAKTSQTPAENLVELNNENPEKVSNKNTNNGLSCEEFAKNQGKLEAFKHERIQARKDANSQGVREGTMNQEKFDARAEKREARQADCDGSGQDHPIENEGSGRMGHRQDKKTHHRHGMQAGN